MGHNALVQCSECGHTDEFQLGVGMMYSRLEHVIELVLPSQRERVLQVLREGHVESEEYEHALFTCPKCHILHGRFHYQVVHDGGKVLEADFQCDRCQTPLKRATRKVPHYRCSACGARALTEQPLSTLWD